MDDFTMHCSNWDSEPRYWWFLWLLMYRVFVWSVCCCVTYTRHMSMSDTMNKMIWVPILSVQLEFSYTLDKKQKLAKAGIDTSNISNDSRVSWFKLCLNHIILIQLKSQFLFCRLQLFIFSLNYMIERLRLFALLSE